MTFGEKLRESRKKAGLSQEELAEKLNVSRQAITKWETDNGIPDISNLMSISNLFSISVDDFISEEKTAQVVKSRVYESVTEYDIDGKKNFDIKLGSAHQISVSGSDEEKIKLILSSDSLANLKQDFKTKIDDIKGRIDVEVHKAKTVSETCAKNELYIEVILPNKYVSHVETDTSCKDLRLSNIICQDFEFDGRADSISIESLTGRIEINCNLDMIIDVGTMSGSIEINQVKATSRIRIPHEQEFRMVVKGIGTNVLYEENGTQAEDFSSSDSENIIEFNGMKSELIIEKI